MRGATLTIAWTLGALSLGCGGGDGTGPRELPPPTVQPPPPPARAIFTTPIAGTPMAEVFYGAYRDQGSRDYQCGFKYYQGHQGTDILLRNFQVQDSGVAVLAAAPGQVINAVGSQFDRSTQNGSGGFGEGFVHDSGTTQRGGGRSAIFPHDRPPRQRIPGQ